MRDLNARIVDLDTGELLTDEQWLAKCKRQAYLFGLGFFLFTWIFACGAFLDEGNPHWLLYGTFIGLIVGWYAYFVAWCGGTVW